MKFYHTLYLDPPWPEHGGGKIKRGADRHYPLVKVKDMEGVIRGSDLWTPAQNAHCYLWVTNNYLPDGLRLMADLGFRYVTNLAWFKVKEGQEALAEAGDPTTLRIGLGQYFRGSHELLLFGVKGAGQDPEVYTGAKDVRGAVLAPRTKHSRKPLDFYDLIERRSHGPYIEFFARSGRPGWDCWGNEAPDNAPTPDDNEDYEVRNNLGWTE